MTALAAQREATSTPRPGDIITMNQVRRRARARRLASELRPNQRDAHARARHAGAMTDDVADRMNA